MGRAQNDKFLIRHATKNNIRRHATQRRHTHLRKPRERPIDTLHPLFRSTPHFFVTPPHLTHQWWAHEWWAHKFVLVDELVPTWLRVHANAAAGGEVRTVDSALLRKLRANAVAMVENHM